MKRINQVMKRINKSIKFIFQIYLYKIAFNLIPQQLFWTKAKKFYGAREKKNDFECLCPHVGCVVRSITSLELFMCAH